MRTLPPFRLFSLLLLLALPLLLMGVASAPAAPLKAKAKVKAGEGGGKVKITVGGGAQPKASNRSQLVVEGPTQTDEGARETYHARMSRKRGKPARIRTLNWKVKGVRAELVPDPRTHSVRIHFLEAGDAQVIARANQKKGKKKGKHPRHLTGILHVRVSAPPPPPPPPPAELSITEMSGPSNVFQWQAEPMPRYSVQVNREDSSGLYTLWSSTVSASICGRPAVVDAEVGCEGTQADIIFHGSGSARVSARVGESTEGGENLSAPRQLGTQVFAHQPLLITQLSPDGSSPLSAEQSFTVNARFSMDEQSGLRSAQVTFSRFFPMSNLTFPLTRDGADSVSSQPISLEPGSWRMTVRLVDEQGAVGERAVNLNVN